VGGRGHAEGEGARRAQSSRRRAAAPAQMSPPRRPSSSQTTPKPQSPSTSPFNVSVSTSRLAVCGRARADAETKGRASPVCPLLSSLSHLLLRPSFQHTSATTATPTTMAQKLALALVALFALVAAAFAGAFSFLLRMRRARRSFEKVWGGAARRQPLPPHRPRAGVPPARVLFLFLPLSLSRARRDDRRPNNMLTQQSRPQPPQNNPNNPPVVANPARKTRQSRASCSTATRTPSAPRRTPTLTRRCSTPSPAPSRGAGARSPRERAG
jgi:hypothetical protein